MAFRLHVIEVNGSISKYIPDTRTGLEWFQKMNKKRWWKGTRKRREQKKKFPRKKVSLSLSFASHDRSGRQAGRQAAGVLTTYYIRKF